MHYISDTFLTNFLNNSNSNKKIIYYIVALLQLAVAVTELLQHRWSFYGNCVYLQVLTANLQALNCLSIDPTYCVIVQKRGSLTCTMTISAQKIPYAAVTSSAIGTA